MSIHVVTEETFLVGQATVVEGPAPEGHFVAVFEDDGETGYFYALDTSVKEQSIQDAVQIYNVANVADSSEPSTVKIGWSVDSMKVVLLINDYAHAVFDYQAKQGFCRTGVPPASSNGKWSTQGHEWNNAAIELFA